MTVAVRVWRFGRAVLPCPLLLLLVGCGARGRVADPAAAAQASADPGTYALGVLLAREQARSADLQAQLVARTTEIDQLHEQVQQLQEHQSELRANLTQALAKSGRTSRDARPQGAEAGDGGGDGGSSRASSAEVAALRKQIADEQERRAAAETALSRLKEETSTPPYADDTAATELTSAQQEITDLRQALDEERATRQRLADQLHTLENSKSDAPAAPPADTPENAELRARLDGLQAEKQAIVESFNRSLAASQQHAAELETQLAAARSGGTAVADPAVQAENAALRTRLEEEHRRTEELANKLKLATRVTDLIFKMQAQQPEQPRASRHR